jgi:outer membrane protein insertion porin family
MSGQRLCFHGRMLAVLVTAAMLAVLLPTAVYAQEGQKVVQVAVTGNKNINKDAITNVIKLAPGATYTKDAVDKDRKAIDDMGLFSAVSVKTESTPEGVRVIYDVVENPVIKEIQIVGNGPISQETIKAMMRTQAGQTLNRVALNTDMEAIQRKYRDEGYRH